MPLFINFFPCTYIQISIISYYFTLPCFTNFLFYVRQLLFIFYYFFYIIRNFNKFWIKIDCLCISKFSFIFIKPIIIICIYTIWMKSVFKPVYGYSIFLHNWRNFSFFFNYFSIFFNYFNSSQIYNETFSRKFIKF